MPPELKALIDSLLQQVDEDGAHNLALTERYKLYRLIDSLDNPEPIRVVRGWLGVLAARRVLPIWQAKASYWEGMEEQFEIDIKILPDLILEVNENVLKNKINIEQARKKLNFYHPIVSSVGEEVVEYNEEGPKEVMCVVDAAYDALWQTVGRHAFQNLKRLEHLNDDELPTEKLDAAGSAMLAYAGGNIIGPADIQKRYEFWNWWLTEAISQAWELARNS
jgi:hypothetical protein